MLLTALLVLLPTPAPACASPIPYPRPGFEAQDAPAQSRRARVRERYHALFEERDAAGLGQLWREHEDLILISFDEDLEAGLALWEQSPQEPDQERIDGLFARALFAARVGSAVTGRPIFHDYAAAFVGWTDDQRRALRVEQQIYQRALGELTSPQIDHSGGESLVAREVWQRALDLGDWWGVAMGYEVEGRAHQRAGMHKEALIAYSQARLYFNQLGLRGSELDTLRHMVSLAGTLESWSRARAFAHGALVLAGTLGRGEHRRELLEARARAEVALGDDEAAAQTALELEELER
jgi:hypothetical protein